MWAFGYTLDNLSLMALTIAVGFVVDDAIVMLENITRYIEEGETPLAAAFRGSSEIGFTIVSISISLVAVLIPLLLMGGIIGRLFREFAVTLTMTIFVSMVVSLTLTPMMASRFLRVHSETKHGRFYEWSERAFDAMLHAYEKGLDLALRWRFTTLMIFFAGLGLSVYLFVIIPKGFFPQQDVGLISATSEAAQDVSFAEMKRRQEALGEIVLADPDVASVAMNIGGSGRAGNNGNMFITLKPRNERGRQRAADHFPAASQARKDRRCAAVHAGGAGCAARRPPDPDAVRVHVAGRQSRRTERMGAERSWPRWQRCRSCATSPPTSKARAPRCNSTSTATTASRYGIQPQLIDDTLYDAFGQRQVTQYFTQLNSYHVILEILPEMQGSLDTLSKLYIKSPLTGDEVPLSTFATWTSVPVRSLSISHQGQFPAITISFNLGQGVALGRRPTPSRRQWLNSVRLPRSIRASRARRRRSSNRSAPYRC